MSLQRVVLTCHNHTLSAGPAAGGVTIADSDFGDPEEEPEN
jgi:hypothetical protein